MPDNSSGVIYRQTGAASGCPPVNHAGGTMERRNRRKIDMGERASENLHANPVEDPALAALLAQLDELLKQAKESAAQQREGIAKSRGATALRRQLQNEIRRSDLPHVARVAAVVAKDQPELEPNLRSGRDTGTIRGFRTAVGTIITAAQANRELLLKHGLAQPVLDDLVIMVDRFEQAVLQGVEARRQHVGATADLDMIADKIVQVVQIMDGIQRWRFARDPERLAAWESASSVLAERSSSQPAEGTPASGTSADVRPAA
jgi:hypothetical protein